MEIRLSEIAGMEVCGDCGDIVGSLPRHHDRTQHGTCSRHRGRKDQPRWPGRDFNQHAELCRCCGAVPLQTGSRWSVWFCGPCKNQVLALGRRHGRCIIPIGRHSLHAGLALNGRSTPVDVHIFAESWGAISEVISLTAEWQRIAVRMNLEAIGCAPDAVVAVERYVEGASGVDRSARFAEMCAYLQKKAVEARAAEGGG